ncbi:tRNA threonylcarbamoyl adenosine modification protein, Sua5/YciO/YrdC/YwlC family [Leptospira wolbachii serovar Codice str. CDC]|uniref:Threonylcarbamoyl-AMP synthase n=1 Tax=Leptospira wolbachii serovar Codice str. CDC TaxID=1218599 RepID=R9ACN7_9LEPT|nr:L-threonylcarbamoyladenylate synthase [Leptospira wolbachii]EOQ97930.1 tRNA threonylcarbamoyl adenosine modification protein, Sua5/YciO/YrdC/YwlC family [Leptospira wolbachii serovar Codice str. CDC]
MKTLISSDVRLLANLIQEGKVVIFPTETVYGIGASTKSELACLRVYEIKGRPKDNPLIAHFHSIESIAAVCELGEVGRALLERFSPGPLTLILPKKDKSLFPKDLDTLAVRIPKSPVVREWIELSGGPISAPSANLSGRPSLTKLSDVLRYFDRVVDGILVAEEPSFGIESTVVSLVGMHPTLLRPGSIESRELLKLLPDLRIPELTSKNENQAVPLSPGTKYKHYAPTARVILASTEEFIESFKTMFQSKSMAWIGYSLKGNEPDAFKEGFGKQSFGDDDRFCLVSSNEDYASKLYAFFESCDMSGVQSIFCEVPKPGFGEEGLRNRLEKAASA